MNLYDQYLHRTKSDPPLDDPAKVALFGILADLTDRRGIGSEFRAIEDDIREEMLQQWLYEIKNSLSPESVQNLRSCRQLLKDVSAEEVDDPEEYLTEFACEGQDYSDAIDKCLIGFGHNEE